MESPTCPAAPDDASEKPALDIDFRLLGSAGPYVVAEIRLCTVLGVALGLRQRSLAMKKSRNCTNLTPTLLAKGGGDCALRCPCSPAHPWDICLYVDEVSPGNQLKPSNERKLQVLYLSIGGPGSEQRRLVVRADCISNNGCGFVLGLGGGIFYDHGVVPTWFLQKFESRRAFIYMLEIFAQVVAHTYLPGAVTAFTDNTTGQAAMSRGYGKDPQP
ncbi:hypothetical protein AK812_SmicGene20786 [Symbiodinium microadriaticum]|uniref:Uncharacterized protein n=1 Tax=Symbiodinium microadriaticum TaxID=2951 RepID=A0A1Q9DP45_SYMMI|nr:hypothetical protein AK812_SmicGene20786 [Symbiodinium microadriaticum]